MDIPAGFVSLSKEVFEMEEVVVEVVLRVVFAMFFGIFGVI